MTWLAAKAAWVLGIAAALWGAILYFKHQGKKDEQAADTEKALQQAKDANAIDANVHNLSQSELDKRLRDSVRD